MAVLEATTGEAVRISLDKQLCKGCEICVSQCPTDVFAMAGTPPERYPVVEAIADCVDCGICELSCPDFALSVEAADE